MRDTDTTPVLESEPEVENRDIIRWVEDIWREIKVNVKNIHHLNDRLKVACEHIQALEKQVAVLEEQRVANEYNTEDPEWH